MENEILLNEFAKRFTSLVTENNTDIDVLLKLLGIKSKSTIYRYMNAQMTPKIPVIKFLADFYNVNPSWLMGYDVYKYDNAETISLSDNITTIPIIGIVKAGYDYLANENWIGTLSVDSTEAKNKELFALQVHGDSMAPAFMEGDIVILKKQNDCENNDIAVVIVNGDEGTLKKVKKTDVGIILQPINPAYPPIMYTNEEISDIPVIIAGVFYELRRSNIKF